MRVDPLAANGCPAGLSIGSPQPNRLTADPAIHPDY
jgi:hypothetical protein